MLSRRHLLAAPAALALPARAATVDGAALPLVLIGDWGRWGHDDQSNVARQMGATAAAINSRFTISLGDNFYENGVTGTDDPQWQASFEQIYTAPSLQSPWKITLGNHDYRGNVQAQLDYSQQSRRWQLPARYYQQSETLPDGGKADFFYLDTSPFIHYYIGSKTNIAGQDSAAQLTWLDQALTASTARWKIVIGHHPVYTALAPEAGYDHDQPDMIARLNPILKAHDIPLYINGHDHTLQSVKMDNTVYVTNGAGSATYPPDQIIRGGFASGAHGFMTLRISSARLDYALIDMHGTTLYGRTITA